MDGGLTMFGNKKKLSQEEILSMQEGLQQGEELIERLSAKQEVIQSDASVIQASREQMEADVRQVAENVENALEYAQQNSIAIASLLHGIEEHKGSLAHAYQDYEKICGQIRQQTADCEQAVEQNKHLTTPSKTLSELPAEMRAKNKEYLAQLEEMADCGKQMGVLALNAAIEAGRMGDSGKSFVGAAEDIRVYARQYDTLTEGLRAQIEASEERIAELENTIHHLIGLLKESNVAATKLMRGAQNTGKLIDGASIRDFSEDMTPMKEEMTGVRNSEEEIIKSLERNRMQLDDIAGEIASQQESGKEIVLEWSSFYEEAVSWKEQRKRSYATDRGT